jgi:hypothetical protein
LGTNSLRQEEQEKEQRNESRRWGGSPQAKKLGLCSRGIWEPWMDFKQGSLGSETKRVAVMFQ